jgi:hypothetical protein
VEGKPLRPKRWLSIAYAIAPVSWEKGGDAFLGLKTGGFGTLPELGYNSQALTNIVRAGLKRCRA